MYVTLFICKNASYSETKRDEEVIKRKKKRFAIGTKQKRYPRFKKPQSLQTYVGGVSRRREENKGSRVIHHADPGDRWRIQETQPQKAVQYIERRRKNNNMCKRKEEEEEANLYLPDPCLFLLPRSKSVPHLIHSDFLSLSETLITVHHSTN